MSGIGISMSALFLKCGRNNKMKFSDNKKETFKKCWLTTWNLSSKYFSEAWLH
jgi:hypothetical protein